MNARGEPPEDDAAREAHHTCPDTSVKGIIQTHRRRLHRNAERAGYYATAWRAGFGAGFHDACRLAARELPPETWATLSDSANRYELARSDA